MTEKEVISTLNSLKQYYNDKNEDSYVGFDDEDNTALEMAIKALDSWEKYSENLWQQAYNRGVKDGILLATMDKECDDCISREEVIKLLEKEDWADTVEGVLELPSVQPPGAELYDCFRVGVAIQNIVSRVDKETFEQIKEYLGEIKAIVGGDTDD